MKTIKNVRLIWDDENGGWFTRHDEPDSFIGRYQVDEAQQHLDHGLDVDLGRNQVDEAMAAAREVLGLPDDAEIQVCV